MALIQMKSCLCVHALIVGTLAKDHHLDEVDNLGNYILD